MFAKRHGAKYYGDYQDVIHSPNVDCVYISTPPALHEELAILAAENKKHIICEKPAVLNMQSLKRVLRACKKNKVKFFENYMYQFHHQHEYINNWLKQEDKPIYVFIKYLVPEPKKGDFRYDINLGGGAFYDMFGYAISLILYFFSHAPMMISTQVQLDEKYKIPKVVSALLKYNEFPNINVIVGYGAFYTNQYSITTKNKIIRCNKAFAIDNSFKPEIEILDDAGIKRPRLKPDDQFLKMIDQFCENTRNARDNNLMNYSKIKFHYKIFDAALKSWQESRSIEID